MMTNGQMLQRRVKEAMMLGPIGEVPQRLQKVMDTYMTKGTEGSIAFIVFEFAKEGIHGKLIEGNNKATIIVEANDVPTAEYVAHLFFPARIKVKVRKRRFYERPVIGFVCYTKRFWW